MFSSIFTAYTVDISRGCLRYDSFAGPVGCEDTDPTRPPHTPHSPPQLQPPGVAATARGGRSRSPPVAAGRPSEFICPPPPPPTPHVAHGHAPAAGGRRTDGALPAAAPVIFYSGISRGHLTANNCAYPVACGVWWHRSGDGTTVVFPGGRVALLRLDATLRLGRRGVIFSGRRRAGGKRLSAPAVVERLLRQPTRRQRRAVWRGRHIPHCYPLQKQDGCFPPSGVDLPCSGLTCLACLVRRAVQPGAQAATVLTRGLRGGVA